MDNIQIKDNLCKYCMTPCVGYCCKNCFYEFESKDSYDDYDEEDDCEEKELV